MPSALAGVETCKVPDARVSRYYCDDDSTHYLFVIGESEYGLGTNRDGEATYFHAYGDVSPICGLEGDFDRGEVTMSTPADANCFEACALCGWYDNQLPCLTCTRDADDPSSVTMSLAEYCMDDEQNYCPETIAEARQDLDWTCIAPPAGRIDTGCGLVVVSRVIDASETTYYFDEQSGALVGLDRRDDGPFGLCHASRYRIGIVPDGPCSELTTCSFCLENTGEAGAPGAAGAAGASNGSLCEP